MFKLDNKEYDESKISDKGKTALSRLQQIQASQNKITLEFEHNKILIDHYMSILKGELKTDAKDNV